MTLKESSVGNKYDTRAKYIGISAEDKRGLCTLLVRPDLMELMLGWRKTIQGLDLM